MRYPGEWKFAGGVVDMDETPLQAAMRELEEEFQVQVALTEAGEAKMCIAGGDKVTACEFM